MYSTYTVSNKYDYLIVGAGLTGATFAWHARQAGKHVLVIDKRDHVAGNCYTYKQEGIDIHKFGPHIFHTSDERVWSFLNRFATFNSYVHRVNARNGDRVFSMPINLTTMNQLWGVRNPQEALERLERERIAVPHPKSFKEHVLSTVGHEVYELLFRDYTRKQWGRDPSLLPASLAKRIPVRTTWDDNYFDDKHQGIPIGGYTAMIEGMLGGCDVRTGADYLADRSELNALASRVLYTGPLDAFYGCSLGALEHRTLEFRTEVIDVPDYQGCAQLNWTGDDVPWTRTIEHKHFTGVKTPRTVVTWETPKPWTHGDEPYYPMNDEVNNALCRRYSEMASQEKNVVFAGRLGRYAYLDMHQCIAQAMMLAKKEGLTHE